MAGRVGHHPDILRADTVWGCAWLAHVKSLNGQVVRPRRMLTAAESAARQLAEPIMCKGPLGGKGMDLPPAVVSPAARAQYQCPLSRAVPRRYTGAGHSYLDSRTSNRMARDEERGREDSW